MNSNPKARKKHCLLNAILPWHDLRSGTMSPRPAYHVKRSILRKIFERMAREP